MKEYRNFYCAQKPKNYLETNALHKQLHTHTHTHTNKHVYKHHKHLHRDELYLVQHRENKNSY